MWYNGLVNLILRSPLHSFASYSLMSITYTGYKSGKIYTVPIGYVYESDDNDVEEEAVLTTSFRHRTWWRSLRGGVPVTLRLRGKKIAATAKVIEDADEVAHYLTVYMQRFPKTADYFYVTIDENGRPHPDELAAAAAKRVIVRTTFPPH